MTRKSACTTHLIMSERRMSSWASSTARYSRASSLEKLITKGSLEARWWVTFSEAFSAFRMRLLFLRLLVSTVFLRLLDVSAIRLDLRVCFAFPLESWSSSPSSSSVSPELFSSLVSSSTSFSFSSSCCASSSESDLYIFAACLIQFLMTLSRRICFL